MPRFAKTLVRMARRTERWEYGYLAALVVVLGLTLFQARIGIPRLLAGGMAVVVIVLAAGAFVIVDNIRSRAD